VPDNLFNIRKLTDLILYSSLWIGACATALVVFTYDVTGSALGIDPYAGFVFCGTLVIYAIHRVSGMVRVRPYRDQGRFAVIRKYRSHILVYSGIAAIGGCYFILQLPFDTLKWLALPVLLSFLYVTPLGRFRRLRDVPFIKIFIISTVWAALTGLIPFLRTGQAEFWSASILFAERTLFIFAITIPFDIRDTAVDLSSGLRTLPITVGVRKSKLLATGALAISATLTGILMTTGVYDHKLIAPFLLCTGVTTWLILNARIEMDDYYYSGLLDGTMFLLAFLYWLWTL